MKLQIHATLGPASLKGEAFKGLLSAGIDGVRLNMSHAILDDLPPLIKEIRLFAPHVLIGADLKGRKLRIGPLPKGEIDLKNGDTFILLPMDGDKMGSQFHATVHCPDMSDSMISGTEILLDDGALLLHVKNVYANEIVCIVERGGNLPQRSGINIPGQTINLPALIQKDYMDLDLLSEVSIDFVYLSYVETADDIHLLRSALKERHLNIPIIAKIELSIAIENLHEITKVTDGLCLARGDLGVEVPLPEIPYVQRYVVESAKMAGKPVFLAGEVLFSLVNRYLPFRAELTDVAVAVEQGVDGFILSDETAIGVDPANAVRILQTLISEAQKH